MRLDEKRHDELTFKEVKKRSHTIGLNEKRLDEKTQDYLRIEDRDENEMR